MTRTTKILFLMHFVGNAILLWMAWEWLDLNFSSSLRLVESLLLLFAILIGAMWLHGSAMAHFAAADRSKLKPALGTALKHLIPLFILSLFVLALYWCVSEWDAATERSSGILKTISDVAVWLFRWLVLPVLALSFAASISTSGFRGFASGGWRLCKRVIFWIQVIVLLMIGVWFPIKLIAWGEAHKFGGFGLELTSLIVRSLIAYLLFVVAWLLLELFTSGGKPRTSQPMTVSAP